MSNQDGRGKIEHVVFIIKENHTFDNYFGTFQPGVYKGGVQTIRGKADLEKFPHSWPGIMDVKIQHDAWLKRDKDAVRIQFEEKHVPGYFNYARQFTLCDNFFTEVAGASPPVWST